MNILFLCSYNAGRSILAEALVNARGDARFRAWSAGEEPKASLPPMVVDLLRAKGLSLEGLRPKSWQEFTGPDAPPIDIGITLCNNAAGEMCMSALSRMRMAHWDISDPGLAATPEEKRARLEQAYAALNRNITELVALPDDHMGAQLIQAINRIGFSHGWSEDDEAPRRAQV